MGDYYEEELMDDNVTVEDDEELVDDEVKEEQEEDAGEEEAYLTQEDFNRTLQRKYSQWERKLARRLGFKTVEEALPYLEAGRVVAQHAQVAPNEIVTRLGNPQQPGVAPPVNPLEQRLDRIEGMLEDDRTAKLLKMQEAEARKEFGVLYEKYQDDIEDKADELGLSLQDAAAIVLRPYLQEHFQAQTAARKQAQRRKRVESSKESASDSTDVTVELTASQKRVARRMNISYKDYYQQLKELGKV